MICSRVIRGDFSGQNSYDNEVAYTWTFRATPRVKGSSPDRTGELTKVDEMRDGVVGIYGARKKKSVGICPLNLLR